MFSRNLRIPLFLALACVFIFALLAIKIFSTKRIIEPNRLPQFHFELSDGKIIDSSGFADKILIVVFAVALVDSDISLIDEINRNYPNDINIIFITSSTKGTPFSKGFANLWIIRENIAAWKALFNPPDYGVYFLYNKRAVLLSSGINQSGYKNGPKAILDWEIKKKRFDTNDLLPKEGNVVSQYPWLQQIVHIIKNDHKTFYVFALFSSICDGCSSGQSIRMLKELRTSLDDNVGIYALLSPSFSNDDISALTSQLLINFPILISAGFSGKNGVHYASSIEIPI